MERAVIVLTDTNIVRLSKEELEYVPKVILLQNFGRYVERLWEKFPEHIKADPEVRGYRRCLQHYNQLWQRDHVDGPAPYVRDCELCQREQYEYKQ